MGQSDEIFASDFSGKDPFQAPYLVSEGFLNLTSNSWRNSQCFIDSLLLFIIYLENCGESQMYDLRAETLGCGKKLFNTESYCLLQCL
jgi:hypothetical protein